MATNIKLTGKIFIKGSIKLKTGLHIGGSNSSMEIGGVDNDIVKTGNGLPFIPGSSLKGKMRSLLARVEGSDDVKKDSKLIKQIFGDPSSKYDREITRLIVRDCHLNKDEFEKTFGEQGKRNLDFDYSEIKTENVIKRLTGSAEHPRQMERVPANTIFDMDIVVNIYEGDNKKGILNKIKLAFDLLNMDYIGGSGSRGYGAVEIKVSEISGKEITNNEISEMKDIDNLKQIFQL